MLNVTPIARKFFEGKIKNMHQWEGKVEEVQMKVLRHLLESARDTLIGHEGGFVHIKSYDRFSKALPIAHYEQVRELIMRVVKGEPHILWPGKVKNFAQSSGTSDGKSKYIPITHEGLTRNHIAGAAYAVASYLNSNQNSRMFSGRGFILGGSFSSTLDTKLPKDVKIGDLSATLISRVPEFVNFFYRVPSKRIALMADWEQKLPALVAASSTQNVTNISGVPSWFLTVMTSILDYTGKNSIREVWPNLEVFFHGGINFEPYREQYHKVIGGNDSDMHYVETYNASEGFFAVQDEPANKAMRLLLDAGIFFEFLEAGKRVPVPAWDVKPGKIYEMLITTCNGLWRYSPGDTVQVCEVDPLRIKVVGRTKHFINAFGEEVMVFNADAALLEACKSTGAHVLNYTAAPVYAHDKMRGRHQWLIEFSTMPDSLEKFTHILDSTLRKVNSDYDAKRSHSLFLDEAEVIVANQGVFDKWLASTGKMGGQRKVPRLSNDRLIMEHLLTLNRRS